MYFEIRLGIEEGKKILDAENDIRTNFGHGSVIVCVVHRLAEGIWECNLDQINTDPEGKRYRLAGKRMISKLYMVHGVKMTLEEGETKSVKIGIGVRQGC
jgi:hypothetical protein